MTTQIPTSSDPLIAMAEGLRIARSGLACGGIAGKYRARAANDALDFAIRVAEIIANNPRGFRQWAKLTSGVVL